MSPPVYECSVCGTLQPPADVSDVDSESPPDRLRNVTCRTEFGGCCRMATLERVPDREWKPTRWELVCLECGYETLAWGDRGFADATRWPCPGCETEMRVVSVRQAWETDEASSE